MTAPKRSRRRLIGLVAAGVTATAAVAVAGVAAADTPPWQQSGSTQFDPNRVGTLKFYNASGTEIFNGSTTSSPLAAYVGGSKALHAGDTKAALYAYLPSSSDPAAAWTGSLLTAASTYPNTSTGVPSSISTLTTPVETGTTADESLTDFIAGLPNKSTNTSYQGIYELRLRTGTPGQPETPTYDAADVKVSGSTWQVVYPQHFIDTTTSLAAVPTSNVVAGDSVTLTATVTSSATVAGTVTFLDGTTSLGSVAVSGGKASKTLEVATGGTHTFHATFTPPSGSTLGTSTGDATVLVGKAATTTTGTYPTGRLPYGTRFRVKATVTATNITPTGTVTLTSGRKKLASAALSAGRVTLTVPATALTPGKHPLTLTYGGSASASTSTTSKSVTITKATSRSTEKLSSKKIARNKRAKLSITVTATGTKPAGKVTIFDGSKKIATGKVKRGKVTVTLPVITKVGKHKIHAVYGGSALVASSTAKTVTLTVVR